MPQESLYPLTENAVSTIRKNTWIIFSVFAVAVLFFVSFTLLQSDGKFPVQTQRSQIWFDDLPGTEPLSKTDSQQVAAYIFAQIREPNKNISPPAAYRSHRKPSILFVSISDGDHQAQVWQGRGQTLQLAVQDALTKLSPALEYGLQPTWIKVDFVQDVTRIRRQTFSQPVELERSLYGLAFDQDTGYAFLPEELVSHTLVDSKANIRIDNIEAYLIEQRGNLTHMPRLLHEDAATIFRFATQGYFSDGTQVWPLYRGHRRYENLSAQQLLESAVAGGRYLTEAVDENGRFVYSYFPKSNTVADDYNYLRHAGTIYAMLELYEATEDPALLDAAERAIKYLLERAETCATPAGPEMCIAEYGEAKLGGNGLFMLALTKYMRVTGSREYLPQVQSMARWVLSIQNENGEFFIHILDLETGQRVEHISEYYPGEALFALARLYQLDGNETWMDAAEKGAIWLITVRDGEKTDDELLHDHWLLYALNEIYRFRANPILYDHAMRTAKVIIQSQHLDPKYDDWFGGYYVPPRSTPTATRSEGLYAAYQLARDFGTPEQTEEILNTLRNGVLFQLGTQFQPESVMYLADPTRSLGAFHRELTNYEIRIDYVQHNISSILGLYYIESDTR
ncbi:MAG: hypothetical protein Kow002_09210 [Anaerolineales bacterium]